VPRKRPPPEPASTAARPIPRIIDANAVYTRAELQALFGFKRTTISREVRKRRLRVSKVAGRYFFLGEWVLAWICAGELRREPVQVTERNGRR
jgi:hypothetical protein